jgi:hypothetical protein
MLINKHKNGDDMKKSVFSLFMLFFLWNNSLAIDSTGVTGLPTADTSGVESITLLEMSDVLVNCKTTQTYTVYPVISNIGMTCPPGYSLHGEAVPWFLPGGVSVTIYQPSYDASSNSVKINSMCSKNSEIYVNLKFVCALKSVYLP